MPWPGPFFWFAQRGVHPIRMDMQTKWFIEGVQDANETYQRCSERIEMIESQTKATALTCTCDLIFVHATWNLSSCQMGTIGCIATLAAETTKSTH